MQGKTHLLVGVVAGATAAALIPTDSSNICIGVFLSTAFGSIFPDIDNSQSMLGRKVKPLSYLLNKMFGHRGFIHSPCNLIFISSIIAIILSIFDLSKYYPPLFGFIIGVCTHLLLDAITKGGIPFLFPFSKKRFNLTTMRTGGIGETCLVACFLLFCGGLVAVLGFMSKLPIIDVFAK